VHGGLYCVYRGLELIKPGVCRGLYYVYGGLELIKPGDDCGTIVKRR
jgi:hypothetical protein